MALCSSPELAALLEAVPDAMVIIDGEGRIAHVNETTEALFGYPRDELLDGSFERLIPERFRAEYAVHRAAYVQKPRRRAMGRRAELLGLRRDGTEFPVEVSLSPLQLDGKSVIIAAIRDVTARREADQNVGRLLDATPDAMVISDAQRCIMRINAQAELLFGYAREELLGRPMDLLVPERCRAGRPDGEALARCGLRKDGSEFPAEISSNPLETERGVVTITAVRDITDRKRAEEERVKLTQAQEAIRLRDEFLSIASHELKTPLTAMIMQLDSILRMTRGDHDADELRLRVTAKAETTRSAMQRLSAQINQLLDLSRITAGRLALHRELLDSCTLVLDVAVRFRDELERAGCELELQIPTGPIRGRWDRLRFEQILNNLVSNAIKYGKGKPVELTLAEGDADDIIVSVRDHGIGIQPSHQQRIFERFERVVSDGNYGGFGLGLWIVRQTVEALGGEIRVWSQPDVGSSFTIRLPRGTEAAAEPPPARIVARAPGCVLLVDDDAMIRAAFERIMRDEGIVAQTAEDGLAALELLRSGLRPRLILLDLMMPVMDGASFRAEQQRDPGLAGIPVVVLSADSSVDKRAHALGVSYLRKPLDLEGLLREIERVG